MSRAPMDSIDFLDVAKALGGDKEYQERLTKAAEKLNTKEGRAKAAILVLKKQAALPDGKHKLMFGIVEQAITDTAMTPRKIEDELDIDSANRFLRGRNAATIMEMLDVDAQYFYDVLRQACVISEVPAWTKAGL